MKGAQSGRYVEERTVSTETRYFELKVFRSNNSHFVQKPRSFLLSIFITSCTFHFDPRLSTLDLTQTESLVPQLWSRRLKVDEPKGKNWSVMRAESGRPKTWTKRLEVDGPKGSKRMIQKTESGRPKRKTGRSKGRKLDDHECPV